jgi:ribulose 1,5-bisphosphate synthetase/thiazole synthase
MFSRVAAAVLAAYIFCASSRSIATDAAPRTDVLVVGGTPAGVAAALAAARRGEDVTLVAQRPVFGGVLTDATMDQWDLNLAPDGGEIEAGIFSEIHAKLGDAFTPADAARVFGDLVASEPRIHAIVNARPIAVQTIDGAGGTQLEDVTFARLGEADLTLAAETVIDATDDGDVAALAGARYDVGRQDTGIDEKMQAVTLMFTIDDVDLTDIVRGYNPRAYGAGGALDRRAWGYAKLMDGYRAASPDVLVRDLNFGHEDDGSVSVNAIDVIGIDGRSAADLLRARVLTETEAPRLIAYLRERLPGFADARIGRFADTVYVRETRHVLGDAWLTADDVWAGVLPADRIGLSSYPLDLHPVTATDRLAYAPIRHVYGVPFGALVPRGFTNLLLASPAISASHEASGSARVIPTTIVGGEAAGAAAALAHERHITVGTLATTPPDVTALQSDLRRNGTILDYAAPVIIVVARRSAV